MLQQIRTFQSHQQDSLSTLVTNVLVPQLVGGISETIRATLVPELQSLGAQQESTAASLHAFGGEMARVAENTAQSQMEGLEKVAQNLMNQMGEQTVELARSLHDALQDTVHTQEQLANNTRQLLEESAPVLALLKETAVVQQEAFRQSKEIHADLLQSAEYWDHFYRTMLNTLETSEHRVTEFFLAIESRTVSLMDQHQLMEEHFFKELSMVSETIRHLVGQLSEERHALESQYSQLKENHISHLTQMAETVDMLPNLVRNLSQAASDVEQHATHAFVTWQENITRDLTHLSETLLGAVDQQMSQLGSIQQSLATQFTNATNRFESVAEGLKSAAYHLQKNAEDALDRLQQNLSAGLNKTFENFDDELSRAIGHLAEGVHELEGAVKMVGSPVHALGASGEILQQQAEQMSRVLQLISRNLRGVPLSDVEVK